MDINKGRFRFFVAEEVLQIMQLILDEVMRTRRARISKEPLEYLHTIFIDKEKLQALRKYFIFSLTV